MVHRGRYLQELHGLLPTAVIVMGKKLVKVDSQGERTELSFADGSTFEADAVIGCDGINSTVR